MLRPGVRRLFRLGLRRPPDAAAEMDDEIAFHLQARVERLVARGWPPDAARAEALRRFGPLDHTMTRLRAGARRREERLAMRELARDTWQDVRHGARLLARYPGFGAGAIVTLAIGIGCASAMFAVVKHALVDPLPYVAPDRLVFVGEQFKPGVPMLVSYPNFDDWRARSRRFDAIEAVQGWGPMPEPVLAGDEPVSAKTQGISAGLFQVLGVRPIVGRWIAPAENRAGAPVVAMISEQFWRAHFGASRDLASLHLTLFGSRAPVVGVMPASFEVMGQADVWFGAEIQPVRIRGAGNYVVIGRLAPHATLAAGVAELNGIAAQLKAAYGDESISSAVEAKPLRDEIIGSATRPLIVLLAAAGFLLLVACANVAMMLLARASARATEMRVRLALGSGTLRLARQAVAESAVLAGLGVTGGLAIAWIAVRSIRSFGVGELPRLRDLHVDPAVTAFAIAAAVGSLVLFSFIPILSNRRLAAASPGDLRSSGTRRSMSWSVLVGVQAMATVIIVLAASLIVRTVANILRVDVGYDPSHVTAAHIPLASNYRSDAQLGVALDRLQQGLRDLAPGAPVGLATSLPSERGSGHGPLLLPPITDPSAQSSWAAIGDYRRVTPGYFEALRIPLLRGRLLEASDRDGAPDVALVNAALAERLWHGENPLGKQVRALVDRQGALFTVVGVVGNAHDWRTPAEAQIEMYVPLSQRPTTDVVAVMRTPISAAALAPGIRRAVRSVDAATPVSIDDLGALLRDEISDRRFVAGILLGFAASVLTLTIVGIFGAVSYAVSRGTREIGIRIAVGASPGGVWLGVQQRVVIVTAAGALAGGAISWMFGRLLSDLLYGMTPHDPRAYASAIVAVLLAGVAAAAWPASRAARTDPSIALRAE